MARTQIQTPGIADGAVTADKTNFGNALVPVGGIIMWSGTTIPMGWSLCNGENGTPNLTNKFIVAAANVSKTGITTQLGSSPYTPGDVGGSANATLVSHSHTATSTATDSGHTHNWGYLDGQIGGGLRAGSSATFYSTTRDVNTGYANVTVTTSIAPQGSPATNANLPPYYALAFIMRIS